MNPATSTPNNDWIVLPNTPMACRLPAASATPPASSPGHKPTLTEYAPASADRASPFMHGNARGDGLEPVMTLTAPLDSIRTIPKGESIGYGAGWICPEDTRTGVVAIGYADGYPRHAPTGTPRLDQR